MRRTIGTILLAMLALSSCAIREDPAPRAIPDEERAAFGLTPTGDAAEGIGRIYLLSPAAQEGQTQLRSVNRVEPANPEELFQSLIAGANEDESARGLSSAVPTDLEILSARTVGTRLTIDVNEALNELSDLGLRQALAQIVATAVAIDQVQLVRLRVNGEDTVWPTGDGEGTDQPLSIYDYPGFLETSQPAFPTQPSA